MNRRDRREAERNGADVAQLKPAGMPILGEKGYANVQFPTGIVKHLVREGEPGLVGAVEVNQQLGPDLKPVPIITRDLYWDAEELVEAIAQRVVELLDQRADGTHEKPFLVHP